MLKRINFFWKMMILAAMTPLAVALVAGIALMQTRALKYEFDNLYGFMLIPIMNLDEAHVHQKALENSFIRLDQPDLTERTKVSLHQAIRQDDEIMSSVVERYRKEWLTSLSPEFTRSLSEAGLLDLQRQEQKALDDLDVAYRAYSSHRDEVLAGQDVDLTRIQPSMDSFDQAFDTLTRVNKRFADLSDETAQAAIVSMTWMMLAGGLLISLAALGTAGFGAKAVTGPLATATRLVTNLGIGNLNRAESARTRQAIMSMQDEVGDLGRGVVNAEMYMIEMAEVARRIAEGDLTVNPAPRSAEDELGIAFLKMTESLRGLVGQIVGNANTLRPASEQLAAAASQAELAASQIAGTMQHIARGAGQQTDSVTKTAASVGLVNRAIGDVGRGAQEQAEAMSRTTVLTSNFLSTFRQVADHALSSSQGAARAAELARLGARTVSAAIAGMETIRTKVGLSSQKVREMGRRSEQIDRIVETINEIASQTNLLALNAAIEAARVETRAEKTIETLLREHLLGAVRLLADLLAAGHEPDSAELRILADRAGVEDFFISDADGAIVVSSSPGSLGFRFSEDPTHQSSIFRPLLARRDGVVVQPIQAREQDQRQFLYVGVSRRDRPGIIQAGMDAEAVQRLGGYSRGFAVVSEEIRKLAEHAKAATKEITVLIRGVQKTVAEAVAVMEDGTRDVEAGSARAAQAGESLQGILQAAEAVHSQVSEIARVVQHMESASRELNNAMEAVSAVVEENIAAVEEMTASSNEVSQAMENIASVSEENSAAVEEVSASTEEVLANIEQVAASSASLMGMAQDLQEIIVHFRTDLHSAGIPNGQAVAPLPI